jgi:hypothetical protein
MSEFLAVSKASVWSFRNASRPPSSTFDDSA